MDERGVRRVRAAAADRRTCALTTGDEFAVNVDYGPDRVEMSLVGELDSYTAPELRDAFSAIAESGQRLVTVDMGQLSYIDSTGLGVLVAALKRLREQGGELRLRNLTDQARTVFEITGLFMVFTIDK